MTDWWVIALCAEWCNVCRVWRAAFNDSAAARPDMHFAWVDVEDEADAMGDVDIETFPTVLVGRGSEPFFLGPVQPQAAQLARLLASLKHAGTDDALSRPAVSEEALPLLARLHAGVLLKPLHSVVTGQGRVLHLATSWPDVRPIFSQAQSGHGKHACGHVVSTAFWIQEILIMASDNQSSQGATRKSNRGFASMDPQRQREIASEGGRAAHEKGTAHEFTSDEARAAGRKGGMARSANRRNA